MSIYHKNPEREEQQSPQTTTQAQQSGSFIVDNRPEAKAAARLKQMAQDHAMRNAPKRKVNKTGIPDRTKAIMEACWGVSLDEVRVHYQSEKPALLNAHAYTEGLNIYIAPGQEQHLNHELSHVLQQIRGQVKATKEVNGTKVNDDPKLEKEADVMGKKVMQKNPSENPERQESPKQFLSSNIAQRYVKEQIGGSDYRVAEDLSVAVREGYPNHELYAKKGKTDKANKKLQSVKSGIELVEQKKTLTVSSSGTKETLVKVLPKNNKNGTGGNNMKLWADCGKSTGVVVGGENRKAEYTAPDTSNTTNTRSGIPAMMKAEIMTELYEEWLTRPDSEISPQEKKNISEVLSEAEIHFDTAMRHWNTATAHKTNNNIIEYENYKKLVLVFIQEYGDVMMKIYNSLPVDRQEKIDSILGINKFADPEVGQGYTMSTGGADYSGYEDNTWNFHWAGVVMESDDNKNNITLENYAVGKPNEQNNKWDFAMYGTDTTKKGQTFHEQHHDTKQHGTNPTTMVIEKA